MEDIEKLRRNNQMAMFNRLTGVNQNQESAEAEEEGQDGDDEPELEEIKEEETKEI